MITSTAIVTPKSAAEAYAAYKDAASAVFLAGRQGVKHQKEHYEVAVDLSQTGLNSIEDRGDEIVIGAMVTMADLAASPLIQELAGGALCRYLKEIPACEEKRRSTVGALVASKLPFSVVLPILLSLHVDVLLQDKGRMNLNDYLGCPPMGEMVAQLAIAKELVYTAYSAYRLSAADEPYLTGAVSLYADDSWRIVVGGRPGMAAIAESASEELTEKGMAVKENVAHLASEELHFANYGTCSEAERRALTIEMVRKLIKEAWKGHSKQLQTVMKK